MTSKFVDLRVVNRYLNLLESALVGSIYGDPPNDHWSGGKYDPVTRALGRDWPTLAQTMIGNTRMRNLRHLCETVILDDIQGDFIETGVWRGGACILMRGIIEAYDDNDRRVFLADSFKGLPTPNPEQFPADTNDRHHTFDQLRISRADVEDNFRRYGLLDDRVIFLEGWFKDTLPNAPIEKLSILRTRRRYVRIHDSGLEGIVPQGVSRRLCNCRRLFLEAMRASS